MKPSFRLVLLWLLTVSTTTAPLGHLIKDDFVVVLSCYAGFEARVAAGRASRQGLQTVVVTNELREDAEQLRKAPNETWLVHKGKFLEDMAPFVAARHLGDSFKWMFVGEDDTLFFREGAATAVRGSVKDMPYILSDAAWFINYDGHRHYLKAEAPQCVPCSYSRDMTKLPQHFVKGCPCSVSGGIPDGFCGPHKMPSMDYIPHGGGGCMLSAGLLQKFTLESMKKCLLTEERADLVSCLWRMGIGVTDPDPIWHPEKLTFFDPTPPPFLTHENIMEKSTYALGKLLRIVTGTCNDICKDEASHLTSLHVNAARIGFTRTGEKRVGDFKDPGEREFAGQTLLRAISRFYRREVLAASGLEDTGQYSDGTGSEVEATADSRLTAAKNMVQGMASVFQEDILGEGEVDRGTDSLAPLTTVERVRAATAAAIARQALEMIIQDATGGTAI